MTPDNPEALITIIIGIWAARRRGEQLRAALLSFVSTIAGYVGLIALEVGDIGTDVATCAVVFRRDEVAAAEADDSSSSAAISIWGWCRSGSKDCLRRVAPTSFE